MAEQKTLLITGGAQRIGAQLAQHFATQGWHLVLHYHRSASAAQALKASLEASHAITVRLVQADLAGDLSGFWQGLPRCHALIHNAAMFERDTLATMQPALLAQQMQVNYLAPLLLTQGFMQQLGEATGHCVLLGDGVMGWSISPAFFSYAASKQALQSSVDLLAAACAPRVQVNMVALAPTLPGPADTAELFARHAKRAPLKRTGDPAEVAAAIDYLLQAPGVTGQVISLANGIGLQSARP